MLVDSSRTTSSPTRSSATNSPAAVRPPTAYGASTTLISSTRPARSSAPSARRHCRPGHARCRGRWRGRRADLAGRLDWCRPSDAGSRAGQAARGGSQAWTLRWQRGSRARTVRRAASQSESAGPGCRQSPATARSGAVVDAVTALLGGIGSLPTSSCPSRAAAASIVALPVRTASCGMALTSS